MGRRRARAARCSQYSPAHLVQAVDGRLGLEEGPDDVGPPLLGGQVQRRLPELQRPL